MENNIATLIKKSGKTAIAIATMSGISRVYLSDLARGKKPLNERVLVKIAKALDVTPSDLIGKSTISSLATIPLTGFVTPGGIVKLLEKENSVGQNIECPKSMQAAETLVFESVDPCFYKGFLLFAEREVPGVPAQFIGCICIVQLPDESLLVRRIEEGSRPGYYDLYMAHSEIDPIRDCRVKSSSFIVRMDQRQKG